MRIHSVTVTAFGPFAGREHVDLERCNDAGLFLLHGPTGSGKTSVLDAVGFALFGRVPGVRHGARHLRSDHADPGTLTEVVLDVTLRGRRLRVTRRPEQMRPARRGRGVTTEKASILLQERVSGAAGVCGPAGASGTSGAGALAGSPDADGWVTRSTRIDEASQLLTDLVGMSADQFFQVVLLPQGDFARFLRADADERMKLLERLFDTGTFKRAAAWLEELRAVERRRLDEAQQCVRAVLERVAQVVGVTDVDVAAIGDEAAPSWLAGHVVLADATLVRAEADVRAAVSEHAAAVAAHRREEDRDRRQRRKADALARQATLEAEAESATTGRDSLAAHDRAAAVIPAVRALDDQRVRVDAARSDLGALLRSLGRQGLDGSLDGDGLSVSDGADADDLVTVAADARERIARLHPAARLETELVARRAALDEQRVAVAALTETVAATAVLLDAVPEEVASATAAVTAAQDAVARLPWLDEEARRAEGRAAAAASLVRSRDDLVRCEEALATAREAWLTSREGAAGYREAWLAGAAARLASELHEGEACPVCGCTSHPDVARPGAGTVTREDVDRADRVVDEAEREVGRLAQECESARTSVLLLTEAAGGAEADPDRLAGEADAAAVVRDRVARDAAALPSLVARLDEVRRTGEGLAARHASAAEECAVASALLADAERSVADDEAAVTVARAGASSVHTVIVELDAVADSATRAAAAVRILDAEVAALDLLAAEVSASALGSGFPDVEAVRAAWLSPAAREALEAAVAEYDRTLAQVEHTLSDPDVANVDLDPPADPLAAARSVEDAADALEAATRAQERARSAAEALRSLSDRLATAVAAVGPRRDAYDVTKELADLTAGRPPNRHRMRLEAFVLAARLEQVAEAASVRLREMSGGRYRLTHSVAGSGAGRRGLGLDVFDAWTMRQRSAATLSGGETFQASLALALGLADVVQAESGGMTMDTLFIDEGFGSLDGEALERVMDTLDALREGGRVVGIVSHVADLQQRVPAKVRVTPGDRGSTVSAA